MEIGRGILNPTHLEAPQYSSPQETYNRLMKSSTRLYPDRDPYVTQRMVNDIEGARMRKEWKTMNNSLKQFTQTSYTVGKETRQALRQQALNITCGNLYV